MIERSEHRFRAIEVSLPCWAQADPNRLAFVSNESGVRQVWTLDRSTSRRYQVSDEAHGVARTLVSPDARIIWWSQATGDERGHWVARSFEGDVPFPLVPDLDDAWSMGISLVAGRIALGLATEKGYRIYVGEADESSRLLYRHEQPAGVGSLLPEGTGGLSADGSLLCIRHSEHGDVIHPVLRILDATSGDAVAEIRDPGRALDPVAWSPARPCLLFTSERGPFERPAVWDASTGARRDLDIDLQGGALPIAWYPDGEAILVRQEHEAVDRLYRVDVRSGATQLVADPRGEIESAVVRPDGEVWLTVSDASHALRPETSGGQVVVPAPDDPPPGRPFRSIWVRNPAGDRIQALVVTPPGRGPFPILVRAHGGPEWHHRERWDPEVQAFVDAGYAVACVNFRGSTGYGIAFRERLAEDPLLGESEDLVACLDALIDEGVADRSQAFLFGWSWGGTLACLNEGLHPDRWRAVFAGVPAGDLAAWHRSAMPFMRALNVATFGGSPAEVPDWYRQRDPMTYVGRARAPVLVIAGEDDPRCPLAAVTPWIDALRRRGVVVEAYIYPSGHWMSDSQEAIRQMDMILTFFERYRAPTSRGYSIGGR
jgi:pimeloyl-ACP methyl ester carboxylesterase